MPALRILFTNNTLAQRAGSELFVRDLALALMKRGHFPIAYSTVLGEVAEELRQATVPVIDDLDALSVAPDLIHAQHHLDAMAAMLRFPDIPVVYVCHGWLPWEELPVGFPSIRRHVAVDDLCRERFLTTPGIDPARVEVITNFADLDRFQPRGALPERPRSALVFSNAAQEDASLAAIRAACHRHGIDQVDIAGASSGQVAVAPEALLPSYDVVFAKARGAIEALAVGCAVVVADSGGLAGLVTRNNVEALRRLNFGVRTMQAGAVTEEAVAAALSAYDPVDAGAASAWIRTHAGMAGAVDRWEALYEQVLAEPARPFTAAEIGRAAASYMQVLAPRLKYLHQALDAAAEEKARLEAERDAALAGLDAALVDRTAALAGRDEATTRWQAIHNSRSWRLMRPLHAVLERLRGVRS